MTRFSFSKDVDGEINLTVACLDCRVSGIELHSRGLCMTCYQSNRRHGTLDEYPTAYFLNQPEEYVYWAVKFYPDEVKRWLRELGV